MPVGFFDFQQDIIIIQVQKLSFVIHDSQRPVEC